MNFSLRIVLDGYGIPLLLVSWHRRDQIEHELIVNLKVRHADGVLIVKAATNLLEDMRYGSRDQTSVLIVLHTTAHCKGLSSTCLSIHHDCPVEPVDHRIHDVFRALVEHVLLTGVMKELIEFKTPAFLLVVNHATCLVLRDAHIDVLHGIISLASHRKGGTYIS